MISRFIVGLMLFALAQNDSPNQLARAIYKELIEINTTDSVGNTNEAAEAMAERLKAAGFPESDIQVLGPNARKGNLVARYRGNNRRKPLLLLAHLDVVEAREQPDLHIEGTDRELLLFDWLKELLYRFDTSHVLLSKFQVHVEKSGLSAAAWGEPLDPARHALAHEVKAITYHGLRLEQTPDGWLAEVIVDI